MAIYRFEAKVIRRSDRAGGRSVVACAAYRSGSKLHDAKYDYTPNYSRRAAGVVLSEIVAPANAPAWATDREQLWNQQFVDEDFSRYCERGDGKSVAIDLLMRPELQLVVFKQASLIAD